MSDNNDFYKNIFKKTEKIVCAVFYTISTFEKDERHGALIRDTEATAERLLKCVFAALRSPVERSAEVLTDLRYAILELESALRILHASRILSQELLFTFLTETDGLLRAIKGYLDMPENEAALPPLKVERRTPTSQRREASTAHSSDASAHEGDTGAGSPDRRTHILSVIRDKGQVSIRDISEVVKDYSEKTIQRDLNAFIKDGLIKREGDRRWSKYSIA